MAQLFERILYLIEKMENTNQSQFARKIGCPQTTLNGYLNVDGQNKIKVSLLDKILEKYPAIRPEWLYMGKEPVFTDDMQSQSTLTQNEVEALRAENELLKAELAEADRVNRKLTARLFVGGDSNEDYAANTARTAGQE